MPDASEDRRLCANHAYGVEVLVAQQVGNLPQQERELKDQEAEKVKGGYGPYNSSGEEIPQTVRK